MLAIRPYRPEDFPGIERVHDRARRVELRYAGLEDAFLPLRIAAEREDLFAYPGLFVAELGGEIAGFADCTQEELAWLYVDPAHFRKGVGRALAATSRSLSPPTPPRVLLAPTPPRVLLAPSSSARNY